VTERRCRAPACRKHHRATVAAMPWSYPFQPRQDHCHRRRKLPVGQISKFLSSLDSKNISLLRLVETALWIPAVPPHTGAYRDRHGRGVRMRWTRQRFACDGIAGQVERSVSDRQHADERCCRVRRSRVVLTPRRWRQVRGCCAGPTGCRCDVSPQATVAKEPGHRGEHEISRKTIACGNAG
jgi:hypothetical protein